MTEKTRNAIMGICLIITASGCIALMFFLETQFALNRGIYSERSTLAAACYGEGVSTGMIRANVEAARAAGVVVPFEIIRSAFQPPTAGCRTPDVSKAPQ